MADQLPKFKPGQAVTFTASAAVTGGQLVESTTGDYQVGPAGATSLKVVGVAGHDAAINAKVVVHIGGVQKLTTTAAAVTAGALIVAAAAGQVVALAAVTTPTAADVTGTRAIVGRALTAVSSAGGVIDVLMGV